MISPRRLPAVLVREVGQAGLQAAIDRNLGPLRGRVNGLRAGAPSEPYPPPEVLGDPPSLGEHGPAALAQAREAAPQERLNHRGRELHGDARRRRARSAPQSAPARSAGGRSGTCRGGSAS